MLSLDARGGLADALRAWFSTFVKEFRSQLEKLPDEQQNLALKGNDFRAPCQIIVFWILEPQYQYAMIIRDPRITYDMTKTYGPALLGTMTSQAETMLEDPWFDDSPTPVDHSVDDHYKKILETLLLGVIETLPEAATRIPRRSKNEVVVVKRAGEKSMYFEWSVFGNLLGQDPMEFAAKTISERIAQGEGMATQGNEDSIHSTTPPITQPTRQGFLSAFYPPIWLGDPLRFGFRDKVNGIYIPPSSKLLRSSYKGRELTILRNGVLTMIEPERSTCVRLLNEIMCAALLLGIPSSAVRDEDLGGAAFYDNGGLGSYSLGISDRRRRSIEKEFSSISEEEFKTFRQLTEDYLKEVFETAEKSTMDPTQSDYAMWFIDAHSYLEQKEYDPSLMKSWLIIEKHAALMWEDLPIEIRGKGKKPLRQRPLPMEKLLKDLRKGNKISEADHRKQDDLRVLRNKIMHKGHHASREEAAEFLSLAEDLTREKLVLSGSSS